MGCGASSRDSSTSWNPYESEASTPQHGSMESAVGRVRRASLTLVEDFTREKQVMDIPYNFVLASASRPDWKRSDYFVFQVKESEEYDDNDEVRSFFSSRSSSFTKSGELEGGKPLAKEGRFYSQLQSTCGTWRIQGNVLTLIWALTFRTDTVIASSTPRRWKNKKTSMIVQILEPKPSNPDWFMPDIIADKFQAESVASQGFECPVCYFELFKFPVGVLRLHSRRCCGHYFHYDCAAYLLKSVKGSKLTSSCPLCGVAFSEVKTMPDLVRDPSDWFCVVDVDLGGELDSYEVIEALGCVMPLNRHKLEKHVKAHWHEWDPDMSGSISLNEFNKPDGGLRDWLLKNFSLVKSESSLNPNSIPSIDKYPRLWFHYWDRNGDGSLEKEEIVRALVRTFCIDEHGRISLSKAHDLREVANSLWKVMGYSPIDHLGLEEFVKPYGMMDQFLHNQTHCAFFGADVAIEELE